MRSRSALLQVLRVALIALALAALPPASAQQPEEGFHVSYAGFLSDADDLPLQGAFEMTVRVHAASSSLAGEIPLWSSGLLYVSVYRGLFVLDVGPLPENLYDGRDAVFVGVTIDGTPELEPRARLDGALLASRARVADAVTGKSHCDCVKVALAPSGLSECPEGREVAGLYQECAGAGCVSALSCCRVCE